MYIYISIYIYAFTDVVHRIIQMCILSWFGLQVNVFITAGIFPRLTLKLLKGSGNFVGKAAIHPCLLGNCVHIPICFQRFSFHHDCFVSGILQSTTARVTHLQPSTTYIFSNEEASPNEQRPKPPAIDKSSTAGAGSTVIRYLLNEDLGYEFNSKTCNHWRLSTLACMARKLKS